MLKKFVSSILAIVLLAGCGSKEGKDQSASETQNQQTCAEIAETLVNDLDLGDSVTEAKTRVVYGSFFNAREGDEGLPVTDAAAYLPAEKNSDTVAVFETTDAETVKTLLETYLSAQKALSEMYSPEEVFKISNAVIDTNNDGSLVVLTVCSDIEAAKAKVSEVLGK
ncbi:MAG: DUF4358 domain-containing protein [Solobacterium sp.]|nr:DUF4358 domain-containing protein [Solobacterium sp.]MBQ9824689.1 DUF4358 domain-containing protein [Solobacterium sp.]